MDKLDSLDSENEEFDYSLLNSEFSEEVDSYEGWNVKSGLCYLNSIASFAHSISLISKFGNYLSSDRDSFEWSYLNEELI